MPYPNSQSPVTLALGKIFSNPPDSIPYPGAATLLAMLTSTMPLGDIAVAYQVTTPGAGQHHIEDWPLDEQEVVRLTLIQAIDQKRPIAFDWQIAPSTSTTVIDFPGQPLGVTFRSPLVYPPYTGP